ncbi:uncharacterized protein LOC126791767 [Argentina anserina]|uniref:uncharacterized protein LOC126791767 n=1 Tax=Argentina anserina TaxID=57926 RepID=UPI0021763A5B|nr:uncharacterized protein LOC126791767 [Potentilla anserina]
MDENSALIESILREEDAAVADKYVKKMTAPVQNGDAYAWQTVSYHKRNRRSIPPDSADVFRSVELPSEDRRRRIRDARQTDSTVAAVGSPPHSDGCSDGEVAGAVENGEAKKVKVKKPKKPKMTVAVAAAKIDADHLAAFLAEITEVYQSQQDILLMRLADYFGRAFASVGAAQFPWLKMLKESTVSKMVDIPLSHISENVYKTSVDWIGQRSTEALGSFVLWSLDCTLADLASHQGAAKGSKKVVQQPSRCQVAIFMVLAMILRRKPDVLISLFPVMRESSKYQGQEKLSLTIWSITQASQGDLVVGLYAWVHLLLPVLSSKLGCNPQSRDLILQSVERILSSPKACPILLNGAVRKGEHIVSPSALDILMRVSFPSTSARIKATERFEAVYPILKDIALAGSPGSKTVRQVAKSTLDYSIRAMNEGISELSKEASSVFIWCLTQSPECYKQWDMLYLDNLSASVVVLKNLSNEWKEHSVRHASLEPLRETLMSFREKNEKASAKGDDLVRHSLLKDADKYCKLILGLSSQGHGCMKSVVLVSVSLALGVAVMSQNFQPEDLKKFAAMFNFPLTLNGGTQQY